jgi:hypothetical protein
MSLSLTKPVIGVSVVLALALAGATYWTLATMPGHQTLPMLPPLRNDVTLQCTLAGNKSVTFSAKVSNIKGLLGFLCWSDTKGEPLWAFRSFSPVGPPGISQFAYGELPQAAQGVGLRQVFPAKGRPRSIGQDERFVVMTCYQYDKASGPAIGYKYTRFQLGRGGVTVVDTSTFVPIPPGVEKAFDAVFEGPQLPGGSK